MQRMHDQWQSNENARSIDAIPRRLLPDGEAREFLMDMALAGRDVDAYMPIQTDVPQDQKRWNIWLEVRRIPAEEFEAYFDEHLKF
jgi:hypothetical protein